MGHALAINFIDGSLDLVDRGQLLLLDDVDVNLGLGGHLCGSVVRGWEVGVFSRWRDLRAGSVGVWSAFGRWFWVPGSLYILEA